MSDKGGTVALVVSLDNARLDALGRARLVNRLRGGNPSCPHCRRSMLRFQWYESPAWAFEYWYCVECDRAGRKCLHVFPKRPSLREIVAGVLDVFRRGRPWGCR